MVTALYDCRLKKLGGPPYYYQLLHRRIYRECLPLDFALHDDCAESGKAILSMVTTANSFETLAATAAYSAVLMVFVQLQAGTH